ncbi:MAG: ribosome biogenesis GTPase Der [Planctomycetota bacterium]
MALPRVAIVGRPNVGKSSIMNMLAKGKVSIVDDTPGVTRDRVSVLIELTGPLQTETPRLCELTDTGGYGVYVAEGGRFDDAGEDLSQLTGDIEGQIAAAVDSADMILFVIDAQAGITALDQTIATMLRERALGGKGRERIPVICVANKVDSDKWEAHGLEAAGFGFGEPWLVSAKVNFRRRDFSERLFEALPETTRADKPRQTEMQLAIVGRRNAGKSSLTNALAGEQRVIVSEIAGTTRDAVDVRFQVPLPDDSEAGETVHTFTAIDTAGVRKRARFADAIEHFAYDRATRSIRRSDVCLLVIDATERITGIDKRLGRLIADEYKPTVVFINKWDLAEGRKNRKGKTVTYEDFQTYIEKEMVGLSMAPIVFGSAKDGYGIREAVKMALDLHEQSQERVSTGTLNSVIKDIMRQRGPASKQGKRAKVLYASQVAVSPPTIVLVVNNPDLFTDEYQRYLLNRFREMLPFQEIPIRLIIRQRRRMELEELLSGERIKAKRMAEGGGTLEGVELIDVDDDDWDEAEED